MCAMAFPSHLHSCFQLVLQHAFIKPLLWASLPDYREQSVTTPPSAPQAGGGNSQVLVMGMKGMLAKAAEHHGSPWVAGKRGNRLLLMQAFGRE